MPISLGDRRWEVSFGFRWLCGKEKSGSRARGCVLDVVGDPASTGWAVFRLGLRLCVVGFLGWGAGCTPYRSLELPEEMLEAETVLMVGLDRGQPENSWAVAAVPEGEGENKSLKFPEIAFDPGWGMDIVFLQYDVCELEDIEWPSEAGTFKELVPGAKSGTLYEPNSLFLFDDEFGGLSPFSTIDEQNEFRSKIIGSEPTSSVVDACPELSGIEPAFQFERLLGDPFDKENYVQAVHLPSHGFVLGVRGALLGGVRTDLNGPRVATSIARIDVAQIVSDKLERTWVLSEDGLLWRGSSFDGFSQIANASVLGDLKGIVLGASTIDSETIYAFSPLTGGWAVSENEVSPLWTSNSTFDSNDVLQISVDSLDNIAITSSGSDKVLLFSQATQEIEVLEFEGETLVGISIDGGAHLLMSSIQGGSPACTLKRRVSGKNWVEVARFRGQSCEFSRIVQAPTGIFGISENRVCWLSTRSMEVCACELALLPTGLPLSYSTQVATESNALSIWVSDATENGRPKIQVGGSYWDYSYVRKCGASLLSKVEGL